MASTVKKINLEQFRAVKIPSEVQAILGKVNGGSMMECHKRLFAATGIWIPELWLSKNSGGRAHI